MWFTALMVLLSCGTTIDMRADDTADQIAQIRRRQWCASYAEYLDCEKEIQRLRSQETGAIEEPQTDIIAYVHTVPWVVWQVMLILIAILLGLYAPYVWFGRYIFVTGILLVLFGTVATIVWYGVYEQTRCIAVVHQPHAHVHVGPASTYPIHATLSYLDEAEMQERLEDWIKVRYPNGYGWIQQDDVTYVS